LQSPMTRHLLPADVLELLSQLVYKSLVRFEEPAAAPRYYMLETIRQYALAKLAAAGEEETVRWRHATYYQELAEFAQQTTFVPPGQWFREGKERDNLRAALTWLQSARGCAELAMRLAVALWEFPFFPSEWSEWRMWFEGS